MVVLSMCLSDRSRNKEMQRVVWLFLGACLLLVVACSKPKPEEVAVGTAKLYYEHLLAGRYDDFLAGTYREDSIPDDYHSQLVDNAKMFLALQQSRHKGIRKIEQGGGTYDEKSHTANVFLMFSYGDGTTEQVLVPMIEKNEVWYLR